MGRTIAIDGPAGAGKSTIARKAAEALRYIYVDTGALYRSIGYYVASQGADPGDEREVVPLLPSIRLELRFEGGAQRVFLNGEDVSEKIRTPQMAMNASKVSSIPKVREFLLGLQRELAEKNDVIMDGRDIGTVVVPGADVKIFLTASSEERARRRFLEHQARGEEVSFQQLLEEVRARDEADTTRQAAPLRQAEDAVLLDTTDLTFEEALAAVLRIVRDRGIC